MTNDKNQSGAQVLPFSSRERKPKFAQSQVLAEHLAQRGLSITDGLKLAIKLCDELLVYHAANGVHRYLSTHTIHIQPETLVISLRATDGHATFEEIPKTHWPFMSPEQTGRLPAPVTVCSDLYSLGVVLYQVFTSVLPFQSHDFLQIVHDHMALSPKPLTEHNAVLPTTLSHLVLKLLQKNVTDRYQTVLGLKEDLNLILKRWLDNKTVEAFPLAMSERLGVFQIPQEFYGRKNELKQLRDAWFKASDGDGQTVWISGEAGIGKTTLVEQLRKWIPRQQTFFLHGKFDALQQNLPYTALVQMLKNLARTLLSQSGQSLVEWKEKILAQIGPYGKLVTNLVPELELVTGVLPNVAGLQIEDYQQQFHLTLAKLFHVFMQPNQLLVLSIDDLHWADEATLQFLIHFCAEKTKHNVLLIGTYRDNETASHGLLQTLLQQTKNSQTVLQLKLGPLEIVDMKKIILDMFHAPLEHTLILTDLIWQKTHGNPFFIKEFLRHIYYEGLIHFDTENKKWQWNIFRIREQSVTDNVADILIYQISRLNLQTQNLLKLAACLGNMFDVKKICEIENQDLQFVWSHLEQAYLENIISPVENETGQRCYRFTHDRLHFAVLSTLSEKNKAVLHRKIGQYYLQKLKNSSAVDEPLFAIAEHLNVGFIQEISFAERIQMIDLNYQAAGQAKTSGAEQQAYHYIQKALLLITPDCWLSERQLALDVYMEAIRLAYAVSDHSQLQTWIEELNKNAKDIAEIIFVYTIKMRSLRLQNRLQESLNAGFEVMQQLGCVIPRQINWFHRFWQNCKLSFYKRGRSLKSVYSLPVMQNKLALSRVKIHLTLLNVATLTSPQHYAFLVKELVCEMFKSGTSFFTMQILSAYGEVLVNQGRIRAGRQAGQLGYKWASQSQFVDSNMTQDLPQNESGVYYWLMPMQNALQFLQQKYDKAVQQGVRDRSVYVQIEYGLMHLLHGFSISENAAFLNIESHAATQIPDSPLITTHKLLLNVLQNLKGDHLHATDLDADVQVGEFIKNHDMWSLNRYYFFKIFLHALFGDVTKGLWCLAQFKKQFQNQDQDFFTQTHLCFFDSLLHLMQYKEASVLQKNRIAIRIWGQQRQLKRISKIVPENFKHKWFLVEAEFARVLGKQRLAMDFYDKAIALAMQNQSFLDAGVANEIAGRFYKGLSKDKIAKVYLQEARQLFQHAGFSAKAQQLSEDFPEFLEPVQKPSVVEEKSTLTLVDWMSVQQAAQVLSRDLEYGELIAKLMDLLLSNTAATKAVLVVYKHGDKPFVEAEIDVALSQQIYNQSLPLAEFKSAPASLINFVKHAREEVILGESPTDNLFLGDDYFQRAAPKSILCLPLMHHREVLGILYLENQFLEKAFSQDRLEVVKLLASQVALTVENAALYATVNSTQWHAGVVKPDAAPLRTAEDAENQFRQKLVSLFLATTELWEKTLQKTHIDLAEESKIWKVHIDGGRLRARIMEKYSDVKTLPKNPRWRDVVKTAYFVLSKPKLELERKIQLEEEINQLLKIVYQRKTGRFS